MPDPTTLHLPDAIMPRIQRLRVEVQDGPDAGQSFEIDSEPLRIGSMAGCDVQLSDASVSGLHLELSRIPQGVQLRDLGSKNGTFLHGARIFNAIINRPTVLRLAQSTLKVTPLTESAAVELVDNIQLGAMLGRSAAVRALFAKLQKVAPTDRCVLVTGETGAGKELAAEVIHDLSPRRQGPLVVVDCGALPANLIESELFGHERGAFTGADRDRPGLFERCRHGTLFLDEIGELPLHLQPVLLGVLERGQARRVGGVEPIAYDVRIIAATNRDLAGEVARGAFRADLYYRLALVEIRLPPLRERPEDIPMLVEHFAQQLGAASPLLDKRLIADLCAYPWPGNVRELRNVVERAVVMNEPLALGQPGCPTPTRPMEGLADIDADGPFKEQKNALIAAFERTYVTRLLAACKGNVAMAARRARIGRVYLYKLIQQHGIEVKRATEA